LTWPNSTPRIALSRIFIIPRFSYICTTIIFLAPKVGRGNQRDSILHAVNIVFKMTPIGIDFMLIYFCPTFHNPPSSGHMPFYPKFLTTIGHLDEYQISTLITRKTETGLVKGGY